MIKGKLFGINKFQSKNGNTICILNLAVNFNQKSKNAIGFDYATGICYGDEADQIYEKVTKLHLIDENVNVGGLNEDFHKITVHDIEKAK